ncbi:MAG TPA: cysteine desulfurase family protein [Frankiaceae bacterium]|jgi:cysteine desulfurase|nr:cysteine desulfurase family protein [Frankiaceae bacterium]
MAYLDHAATTPVHPAAIAAVVDTLSAVGNASSLHASGRNARRTVEESRESVAAALDARPSEVIFTSGGTESDNMAIKGLFWAQRAADPRRRRLLISGIEHHAVLDSAEWLAAEQGAEIVWLPVDRTGRVEPAGLYEALSAEPDAAAVVSVMWANNEVGTVQPIAELTEIAHEFGAVMHSDAVQAVGALPVSFAQSGLDAMTVTGHKFGGPYGTGGLLLKRGITLTPLTHGGGQEREVRSGTLDVPGVAGFAAACRVAVDEQPERAARVALLRDALVAGVRARVPDVVVNGAPIGDSGRRLPGRLPGNAHLSFPGCEGDSLLMLLDARGVECSTGSACSAGIARPSHVLLAMQADAEHARSSLRFSLGHTSTHSDVTELLDVIGPCAERSRRAGALSGALTGALNRRP